MEQISELVFLDQLIQMEVNKFQDSEFFHQGLTRRSVSQAKKQIRYWYYIIILIYWTAGDNRIVVPAELEKKS